jgi:hypothetical protein
VDGSGTNPIEGRLLKSKSFTDKTFQDLVCAIEYVVNLSVLIDPCQPFV